VYTVWAGCSNAASPPDKLAKLIFAKAVDTIARSLEQVIVIEFSIYQVGGDPVLAHECCEFLE